MDCTPHIHIAAYHAEPGFKSATPGVGVLCRDGDISYGAGGYSNSIGRGTVYGALGLQPLRMGDWRFGVLVGAATGYVASPVVPLGGLFISTPKGVNLTVIPPVQPYAPLTIAISWEFR
jgi:hypothetical protein